MRSRPISSRLPGPATIPKQSRRSVETLSGERSGVEGVYVGRLPVITACTLTSVKARSE